MQRSFRARPSRALQAGLSLLEILIATVVLSAGLLGLAGMQIAALKTTHNSYQVQQATWLLHDLLERMRANRQGVVDGRYILNTDHPTEFVNTATYCANPAPSEDCLSSTCNIQELAASDLYRVVCGYGGNDGIDASLMSGQMSIACLNNDCNSGVSVKLRWQERLATKNVNATKASVGTDTFDLNMNIVL
jgi:type IV pilus assembly protein PilV